MDERIVPVVAGVFGGLSGAMAMARANLVNGWREFMSIALVGMLFATFVVPFICDLAHLNNPRALAAMGYLGGVVGNLVVVGLVLWINGHRTNLISLVLRRLLRATESVEKDGE